MTRPAAVVTGAAAAIGRAVAELFAERGYGVVAVDLAEPPPADLARTPGIVPPAGDVAEEAVNEAAVRLTLDRFGSLGTVVLNAGIGGTPPLEAPGAVERFDRMVAVNLRGPGRRRDRADRVGVGAGRRPGRLGLQRDVTRHIRHR
ncbi:SDR family NAD(P)-dependent oxidoreductase [Microbispora hainanensis]|uniref:SDR family NAD(P)-dependent oxidoreductase n=1 Tax=Microbispora hainanensis TaxID=568844 RepID=UPI002E29C82B|nr:SDR family NAD(P)-dependent oxidoreductase [Microbispora hainanensis]